MKNSFERFFRHAIQNNIYYSTENFKNIDYDALDIELKGVYDYEETFKKIVAKTNTLTLYEKESDFIFARLKSNQNYVFASKIYYKTMLEIFDEANEDYLKSINYGIDVSSYFTKTIFKMKSTSLENYCEDYMQLVFWEAIMTSSQNVLLTKSTKIKDNISLDCINGYNIEKIFKVYINKLKEDGITISKTQRETGQDAINSSVHDGNPIYFADKETLLLDFFAIRSYVEILQIKYKAIKQISLLMDSVKYDDTFWEKYIKGSIKFHDNYNDVIDDSEPIEEEKHFSCPIQAMMEGYIPDSIEKVKEKEINLYDSGKYMKIDDTEKDLVYAYHKNELHQLLGKSKAFLTLILDAKRRGQDVNEIINKFIQRLHDYEDANPHQKKVIEEEICSFNNIKI